MCLDVEKPSCAVLMTCHNRRDSTISCLSKLYSSDISLYVNFRVYLVDDGSTDQTAESVAEQFPDVTVVPGSGHLYWNRGMRLAWESAAEGDYDFYMWLNDDTYVFPAFFGALFNVSRRSQHEVIVCGATVSVSDDSRATYGGYVLGRPGVLPVADVAVRCDYFNGNVVLVSRHVYEQVGLLDRFFRHALGDFDYGLRARKLKLEAYIAPGVVGVCELHKSAPKWTLKGKLGLFERWRAFRAPTGADPWRLCVFEGRHLGWARAVFHYFSNYWTLLFGR